MIWENFEKNEMLYEKRELCEFYMKKKGISIKKRGSMQNFIYC